jgi:hypothetical protein
MKKRKMIGDTSDSDGMPVVVTNDCDSPSNSLMVVVLSLRKLSIQRICTSGIRHLRRLWRSRGHEEAPEMLV